MYRFAPVLAGLLLVLLMPLTASAHDITNVQVDCDGHAILVSGKSFASEPATVTVTGPGGYSESFFADQDAEWTLSLPLGPNGDYQINWPGAAEPVDFKVDCAETTEEPTATPIEEPTATRTATPPEGSVLPTQGTPTPTDQGKAAPIGGAVTPPATDTARAVRDAVPSPIVGVVLFGLAAATVCFALAARDRARSNAKGPR